MPAGSPVYLDRGRGWVFACSLEFPGWSSRGRGDQAALEALLSYWARFAAVAGLGASAPLPEVVGEVSGDMGPDFGAATGIGPWDQEPLEGPELERFIAVLQACWLAFDEAMAQGTGPLRPGPRGGGRDREKIEAHVMEAERAYARKGGLRLPPRTAWDDQRQQLAGHLRGAPDAAAWTRRYTIRRCAWHLLDHAWEIEDRTP